jgi:thiol peroxidase
MTQQPLLWKGAEQQVIGPDIEAGQQAPHFTVVGNDWKRIDPLVDTQGLVRILASLPSLETSVCDRETKHFNDLAKALPEDIRIFALSNDLPITQARWCGAAGVENVDTLSDHVDSEFGKAYGCLMLPSRLLRRAVFVVDRENVVRYADYMPTAGDEPDYEAVIQAAKEAH